MERTRGSYLSVMDRLVRAMTDAGRTGSSNPLFAHLHERHAGQLGQSVQQLILKG